MACIRYGETTQATLLYLLLEAAGVRSVAADHAASHLGKAIAIALQLRAVPFNASQKRVLLPSVLTAHYGAPHQDFFTGKSTPAIRDALFDLASTAHAHLEVRGWEKKTQNNK
jgi:NADH dehydrogenase [ubiquinone] 1 alpha subcomplex assembly factor 6